MSANTWLKHVLYVSFPIQLTQISQNVEEERSSAPLLCCRSGLYSREQTSAELWHPLITELRGGPRNCLTQRSICPRGPGVCVNVRHTHHHPSPSGRIRFLPQLSATDLEISARLVATRTDQPHLLGED